jgi:hypothetical protein
MPATSDRLTHVRVPLVLQEPRHCWPNLTSVVDGHGCPPFEMTCGAGISSGRRVIICPDLQVPQGRGRSINEPDVGSVGR